MVIRAQIRWVRLGLFQSISPVIKYQPSKSNMVADILSKRQSSSVEEEKKKETLDETISTLIRTQTEMDREDYCHWIDAYRIDLKLTTVFKKLRQGRRLDDYVVTSVGIIGIQKHGQKRVVVPMSLRQFVMQECYNVRSVGHVSIHTTLNQMDRQFYWSGFKGDITSYMKSYPTCQWIKLNNSVKAGLLQPEEIPTRKWA